MSTLPPAPDLEQLKKRARDLLEAHRAGDPEAGRRVAAAFPRGPRQGRPVWLADALLVVAREHGFPSWPQLKARVAALARNQERGAAPTTSPAPAETKAAARRQLVRERTASIADAARRRDIEGLVELLVRLPRRDLLAARAAVVEAGASDAIVAALVAGLDHPSPRVRHDCAQAVDHFADARCVGPLRRLTDDPVPRVRRVALHSLSCEECKLTPLPAGGDVVATLIDHALADPSINVRRHATYGLGTRGDDPRAVAALRDLLAREPDRAIQRAARQGLRRAGAAPPEPGAAPARRRSPARDGDR
ncbi:MAG TPA: HEAT repeat domain-containing protein [Thermomicrobiales bacterium]|nr:HEAT repeat domain-containing protein [Thermomicrobiales bacterium]